MTDLLGETNEQARARYWRNQHFAKVGPMTEMQILTPLEGDTQVRWTHEGTLGAIYRNDYLYYVEYAG